MKRVAAVLLAPLIACDAPPSPEAVSSSAPPPVSTASAVPSSTTRTVPVEVAAQHVLVAWKGAKNAKGVTRSKDEAKKLAEEIQRKAASGADFAELVKQHSDDPASKERLGSVGKFKRDEMVKPFADAAFALEVGAISQPVESEYGFHVIKRNQ